MGRRRLFWAGGIAAAALILAAAVFLGTHVYMDGTFFPRDAQVFDLTDHDLSVAGYEKLRARYPEARILWTVPFQGERYPTDTQAVTVTTLTEEEARTLDHLPELTLVDGTACQDLEALLYLARRRPEVRVLYQVPLGGESYPSDIRELTAKDVTAADMEAALPHLLVLETLRLEGTLPEPEALRALRDAWPQVAFCFHLDLGGRQVPWDVQELDLTGTEVTQGALEGALPWLTYLQQVDLIGTGLPNEALMALMDRFPEVFFLATLDIAGTSVSTGDAQIDLSGHILTQQEVEALLPYLPKLEKLILSDCGLDNETLDTLNRRYEDLSIVWSVQVGRLRVRTDATVFYPAGTYERWMPNDQELEALRYCTELIALDLGHAKATRCDFVAYMPHLKYLILADSRISDISPLSGLKELVYLELFGTQVQDYTPLLGCTALQDLNIGSTHGDPEPLSQMTWLHTLLWHRATEAPQTYDAVMLLPQQLPDTCVVLETWRNVGDVWRYLPNYYTFRDLIGGGYYNQAYTLKHWGTDAAAILDSADDDAVFAGDLLAQIVRRRIDSGEAIPGIKNVGSEKAEALYQSLLDSRP